MSNSETPTPTVASDWLVSITPTPRGDWQLPGGPRFNLTIHNGATPDDVTAALATLAAISTALVSAYEAPSIPPGATHALVTPPSAPARQAPPPPEGTETEDVFGIGHIQVGGLFDVEIERAVKTATGGGKPKLDLYRPNNQYPFATVNENQFDAFHTATGVHGNDMAAPVTFNPLVLLRFKVGKKKQKSEKHYIDFVGAATAAPATPAQAPSSNDMPGAEHVRDVAIKILDSMYPQWNAEQIAASVDKLTMTPETTASMLVEAFVAKAGPAPKAPA